MWPCKSAFIGLHEVLPWCRDFLGLKSGQCKRSGITNCLHIVWYILAKSSIITMGTRLRCWLRRDAWIMAPQEIHGVDCEQQPRQPDHAPATAAGDSESPGQVRLLLFPSPTLAWAHPLPYPCSLVMLLLFNSSLRVGLSSFTLFLLCSYKSHYQTLQFLFKHACCTQINKLLSISGSLSSSPVMEESAFLQVSGEPMLAPTFCEA